MKNIIFDLGKVILPFDERQLVSNFTTSIEEQDFLINNAINSPEWAKFGIIDSGFITKEEVVNLINDRTNNKNKELVHDFMLNNQKYRSVPTETINLLKDLKQKGYKIYMLSNTSEDVYEENVKQIEHLFDGIVLSYQVHAIKPYNAIYEYIINHYNIVPEESLFLDDRQDNIDTANQFGINGRVVKENDLEDIKRILKEYGIGE